MGFISKSRKASGENDELPVPCLQSIFRIYKIVNGFRAEHFELLPHLPFPRDANRSQHRLIVDLYPRRSSGTKLSCDQARADKRRSRKFPTDKNSASDSGITSNRTPRRSYRNRDDPWATRMNPSSICRRQSESTRTDSGRDGIQRNPNHSNSCRARTGDEILPNNCRNRAPSSLSGNNRVTWRDRRLRGQPEEN